MSFPNIPDISPEISVTFEDAINLLLTSIAMEEVSLSKLMDAETKKICCVLDDCKQKESTLYDAIRINKSVDDTIQNMIKLQMLLQFKLEDIKEILPCTSSSTTTTTTSTSTSTSTSFTSTCSHTTTCSTSTGSTTTYQPCNPCHFNLTGRAKGRVSNCCDPYCGDLAELYVFLFYCDPRNRTIRYKVGEEGNVLSMTASGFQINMDCPDPCSNQLLLCGRGRAQKQKCGRVVSQGLVGFTLTLCYECSEVVSFRMVLQSEKDPLLNHDSGTILVSREGVDSRLNLC